MPNPSKDIEVDKKSVKKQVKFKYTEGTKGILIKPKSATKQDSLDVYNSSMKINAYYSGKNYKQGVTRRVNKKELDPFYSLDVDNKNYPQFEKDMKKGTYSYNEPLAQRPVRADEFRKTIDGNRFQQREAAKGVLDLHSPMPLYDRRIQPQYEKSYNNENVNSPYSGDFVSVTSYDPIAVKPWQMLSPSEKKQRTAKYGNEGTPMNKTKSVNKVNTTIPQGIKTKSKEVAPYQPKSKADEVNRKQMYADSSDMSTKGHEIMYSQEYGVKANQKRADEKTADANAVYLPKAKKMSFNRGTVNEHPNSIKVSLDKESDQSYITKLGFPAPKQKVLDYIPPGPPPVAGIKRKKVGVDINTTPLPTKLDTVAVEKQGPSIAEANRTVTKVKYTPSTKPGYEKMRDYGTYSKNGDELDVPKSAIQATYAKGTSGIQVSNPTTKLKPGQEVAYNQWRTNNKIEESDDYDLKGYWKETGYKSASHDGHFPDTYKLKAPFSEGDRYQQISDESKYSGNPGYLSGTNTSFDKRGQGTWNEDKFEAYSQGTQAISVLPSGSKTPINTMKQPYKMKSKKLQKAAGGLNDVAVPEAGNMGNVLSSGLSMGATGAELGGPWGAAAGAVAGIGLGLWEKNKQDDANRTALNKNISAKVNRSFDGIDVTANQKQQVFEQGTNQMKAKKTIEVEGDEHHFDSDLNHKGVYKGASHAKGGIVTDVEEGDVIIPKKHKGLVDKALKVGDFKKIDKLRKTLPKDTPNGKAVFGLNNTDPDTSLDEQTYAKRDKSLRSPSLFGRPQFANATNRKGAYNYTKDVINGENGQVDWLKQGEQGNPNAYAVSKVKSTGTMYRDDNMPQTQSKNIPLSTANTSTQVPSIPTQLSGMVPTTSAGSGVQDMVNESNPVGNIAKYANIANNTIRGFQDPVKQQESYLDPNLLKYTDRSETLRQASRQGQSVQNANARNASGGMVANLRANQAASNADNLNRQEGINETEMQRADTIDNTNVGIKNNTAQINLTRKDAYQDQMMKARAVQESYRDAATNEIAQQATKNEQDGYLRSRDGKLDQLERDKLNSENQWRKYKSDAKGNISFKSNGDGGSIPGASTPQVTKSVSIGTNGKTSTRTTTKSAAPLRMKANSPIKRRK